jgi:hypothetical protein
MFDLSNGKAGTYWLKTTLFSQRGINLMPADDVTMLSQNHTSLAQGAVELAERWVNEGAKVSADPAAERLAGVLKDPNGLDFTIGFVDRVVRPHDLRVA